MRVVLLLSVPINNYSLLSMIKLFSNENGDIKGPATGGMLWSLTTVIFQWHTDLQTWEQAMPQRQFDLLCVWITTGEKTPV